MIDIDLLLTWGATYKQVQRDAIIFHESTCANFYYQVISGRVRWVSINEESREFIHLMVEKGECFGELPLFDDGNYAATAIADEEAVLLRLHKSNFLQLLKDNPAIHFAFTKLLAERMRFKFLITREMAYYNPEHRISTLLSYLKKNNKLTCSDCKQIKLTRQQIADMTGLRVETVIRAMRHLHEKGALLIEKGKVYTP